MVVMAREAWTDERLDDLSTHVDRRFDQVDQRFDQVDQRFDQVDQRFERVEADIRELRSDMKAGFAEVNARFDSMQRTMIIGFVTLIGSVVASVLGGILITQL
jgi:DNA anti-recombination protein RmuC